MRQMPTNAGCCCLCSASAPRPRSTSQPAPAAVAAASEQRKIVGSASEFVVVANRLPVDLETLPDGSTRWKRSPGGLVTALEPILRGKKGTWVGWPGVPDTDLGPIVEDGIELYPVRLSAQE